MIKLLREIEFHFLLAFVIRIVFTLFGLYHDSKVSQITFGSDFTSETNVVPKYTDIDYQVFSDAAIYVYHGESPYNRETYRYTPLLAYLLQANIYLHESAGKLLFVLFDLICGYLILKINKLDAQSNQSSNLAALAIWFYNPITVAIASRGNAESVMAALVLSFIYFIKRQNYVLAGLFYALAVHFKIYPITYALVILFYFIRLRDHMKKWTGFNALFKSTFFNSDLYKFGFTALFVLISLTSLFYFKYGYEFLYETYLYHLSRQDTRHNFSPYFYMLYLTETDSLVLKIFNFLPQLILILVFSIYFSNHIEFALFSITFMFVTFNKVCTSQYFVWYLSIIPLLVHRLNMRWFYALGYFLLWMFGQAVWLYFAYELEFNGKNTFLELWVASLLFAVINCIIYKFAFLNSYNFNDIKLANKKTN